LKDHKKLVFWALILAAVLGTIMMVLGQTVLAAVGVLALKVAFASLGTLLTGTILVVLGWIALAMGVLIALWILDVNGFKKYWSSIFGRIWDGMKQFFTNLVYGFKSIFVAIGKLLEGNVAGFASYLLKGFAQIFLGIISLMQGFANMFVQLMIWIAKTALKIFIGLFIDPFVYAIAKLIRFWAAAAAKLGMKSTAKMAYNVANSVEGVGSSLKSGVDTGADWMSTKYDNQVQKIQNVIGDVSITIKNLETDNPAEMGKGIWDALYKEIKENM